mmetsp:Transcript_79425/g.236643  ORF Transcript_79425/g.236643 Transcript_79425/m.236643 type:complete len:253 (+) Transcript_79425:177-935(+)
MAGCDVARCPASGLAADRPAARAGSSQPAQFVSSRVGAGRSAPKSWRSTESGSTPPRAATRCISPVAQRPHRWPHSTTKLPPRSWIVRSAESSRDMAVASRAKLSGGAMCTKSMSEAASCFKRTSSLRKSCRSLSLRSYISASTPNRQNATESAQEPAKTSRKRAPRRDGPAEGVPTRANIASARDSCQRSPSVSSATKTAPLGPPAPRCVATGGRTSCGHQPMTVALSHASSDSPPSASEGRKRIRSPMST